MSDIKLNEPRDTLDGLKFLSQTHRSLHEQRRKLEFEILFTSIGFYVLAVAARFSGKVSFPASRAFVILIILVCLGLAAVASAFLRLIHRANLINKSVAECAENEIMQMLSQAEPKPQSSWSYFCWLWQTVILFFFAVLCAFLLTLT